MTGADEVEKQIFLAFPNGLKYKNRAFTTDQKEDGGQNGVRRPANGSAVQEKPKTQIAEGAETEQSDGHRTSAVRRKDTRRDSLGDGICQPNLHSC